MPLERSGGISKCLSVFFSVQGLEKAESFNIFHNFLKIISLFFLIKIRETLPHHFDSCTHSIQHPLNKNSTTQHYKLIGYAYQFNLKKHQLTS